MKPPIGIFQCEWTLPDNAPHPGSALLVGDALASGYDVTRALVQITALDEFVQLIQDRSLEFVAIDAIFPVPFVRELRRRVKDIPIVVGGLNALQVFLGTDIDYAIVGPGRAAFAGLLSYHFGDSERAAIPNLFYREGNIRCHTGLTTPWSIDKEIDPFHPNYDWEFLGPIRSPMANRTFLSVNAELGCHFQKEPTGHHTYELPETHLPQGRFDTHAERVIREGLLPTTGGCTFCIFRYQTFETRPTTELIERTVRQVQYLRDTYGILNIALQSENPFHFLIPLLEQLHTDGIRLHQIHLRTTVLALLGNKRTFEEAVQLAGPRGTRLSLVGIGFESFDQESLDLFNKGVTVEMNIEAMAFLREVQKKFPEWCETRFGHGMIFFHPYATLEQLEENLSQLEQHAPELLELASFSSSLTIYSEIQPIFWRLKADDLLVSADVDFGYTYHYKDPRTAEVKRSSDWLVHQVAASASGGPETIGRGAARRLRLEAFRATLKAVQQHWGDASAMRATMLRCREELNQRMEDWIETTHS